jgi:hypothetical protein
MFAVLAAINSLLRFRDFGKRRDYLLFLILAAVSVASKQLAVFLFPTYALLLLRDGGWARVRQRRILPWTLAGGGAIALVALATLFLSPFNVQLVINVLTRGLWLRDAPDVVAAIVSEHLRPSLGVVAACGLVVGLAGRDGRLWLGLSWVGGVLVGLLFATGPYDAARYGIYAVPGYCLLAAAVTVGVRTDRQRTLVAVALAAAVSWQLWSAARVLPAGGGGYETAAKSVLSGGPGPTVLYSASVDTGYFVFFVRKHDPQRRLVVLRSDKLLTTSFMGDLSQNERIRAPEEIYPLLDRYGTRFIVIEDRPSGSDVLDWLREEVKSDRFVERSRVPITTRDRRLRNVDLVIYEYKDAKAPHPDAELDLALPLVGRDIRVRLADLQAEGAP